MPRHRALGTTMNTGLPEGAPVSPMTFWNVGPRRAGHERVVMPRAGRRGRGRWCRL